MRFLSYTLILLIRSPHALTWDLMYYVFPTLWLQNNLLNIYDKELNPLMLGFNKLLHSSTENIYSLTVPAWG